jgi:cell wall-associated NlpC family hydrolase
MNYIKLLTKASLGLFLFVSCSTSFNLRTNEQKANIPIYSKLPFEEEDFLSSETTFYQIVNSRNKSLNIAKQKTLTSAKVLLSQQISNYILTITNQSLTLGNGFESEMLRSRSKAFSILFSENLKLVDSKIFKTNDGFYEYWAVYSIELNNTTNLNSRQTILDKNVYSRVIEESITSGKELKVSSETKTNNYFTSPGDFNQREKVELESLAYKGVPYVWGGETPEDGFDCSGYVQWVYKKSIDKQLPRTTAEHNLEYKELIVYNSRSGIQKGDLVYFRTVPYRDISHVGIYLGMDTFIHAPNERETIQVQDLQGYWLKNYVGYLSLDRL